MLIASLTLMLLTAEPSPPPALPDLSKLSLEELINRARQSAVALGTYEYTVRKRERIDHQLAPEETLQMTIREKPYAVRFAEIAGPHVGRLIVYNSALRPDDFRVREPGAASILGALWIGLHSPLARNGTRHVLTDSGFGALLAFTTSDLERARPFGGRKILDAGYDNAGHYCVRTAAPEGAAGSYAPIGRICHDPFTFLPATVDVWDNEGLVESYVYSNLRPRVPVDDTFFTPEAAGL